MVMVIYIGDGDIDLVMVYTLGDGTIFGDGDMMVLFLVIYVAMVIYE